MSPSKGRFSMAASSSRIWVGVGTSQPYSMSFLPGAAPKQHNPARPIQQLKKADRMCGSMAAHLLEITSFAYPQRLPLPDDHHQLLAPRDDRLIQG
jgi:hypothetical protein